MIIATATTTSGSEAALKYSTGTIVGRLTKLFPAPFQRHWLSSITSPSPPSPPPLPLILPFPPSSSFFTASRAGTCLQPWFPPTKNSTGQWNKSSTFSKPLFFSFDTSDSGAARRCPCAARQRGRLAEYDDQAHTAPAQVNSCTILHPSILHICFLKTIVICVCSLTLANVFN